MSGRFIKVCLLVNFVLFVFSCTAVSPAQGQKEEPKITIETKQITGQVSALTSRFIAVVYDRKAGTEYEMALPIVEDAKLERKESLEEIDLGDTVRVTYE